MNLTESFLCFSSCTVRSLGLNPLGEDTGTAEVLSRVIIERTIWVHTPTVTAQVNWKSMIVLMTNMTLYLILIIGEDTNIPPFFFPCGSIKREVLPTALRDNGKHSPMFCLTIKTQGDKSPTGVYANYKIIIELPLSQRGICFFVSRSAPGDSDCLSNSWTSRSGEKSEELFHRAGKTLLLLQCFY